MIIALLMINKTPSFRSGEKDREAKRDQQDAREANQQPQPLLLVPRSHPRRDIAHELQLPLVLGPPHHVIARRHLEHLQQVLEHPKALEV